MDMSTTSGWRCQCGSTQGHVAGLRSVFWQGDGLIVVEGIPALVCDGCGEPYYDDETTVRLDLLRGGAYPGAQPRGRIEVPVFEFDNLPASGGGP